MKTRILVAGAIAVLVVVSLLLVFDWPWWLGMFLILLVAGLALAGFFLRIIWLRRRERNFAGEVGALDLAKAKAISQRKKDELDSLQGLWKSAINALNGSKLNKLGNPMYVLPWYLMMGESGSGKSSSLNGARLSSPIRDSTWDRSATRHCEWWFFEQAVVIDTAGRYAMQGIGDQDRDEWQRFLSLLMKYRGKEPLSGVIVTVAADRLREAGEAQLERDGGTIRRRIDELMRAVGVRIPVYLLVTKCDLIPGMNDFCRQLPANGLDRAMGVINQELSPNVGAFLDHALRSIGERLRNLRLQLLHQPQAKDAGPELLLIPEEFEQLQGGLSAFTTHAFGENPYQETPVLRGIFFGSARQEGKPCSRFSRAIGRIGTKEALPVTDKGFFLHDFFAEILPRDRSLLLPTRKALEWKAVTGNLGLTTWVILGVALCGLLSFSFVKNMNTIRHFTRSFATSAPLRGDLQADLDSLESFRRDIARVEEQNRHWWIPRFGLTESLKVEKALKERFCRQFRSMILAPFDRQMAQALAVVSPATLDDLYARYAMHLVRRINLLKTGSTEKDRGALQSKTQPIDFSSLRSPAAADAQETGRVFGALYLSALAWRQDDDQIAKETALLQSWLKQLLAVKRGNLQWLAVWVDRQSGVPPVTLKDFWGGNQSTTGEKSVAPVFTRQGKETLEGLFRELQAAVPGPSPLAAQGGALGNWYRGAAFEAWHVFAADFSGGRRRLRTPAEWQQAASLMSSQQGPYFALLGKIAAELEPLVGEAPLPPWLQQVYRFQSARAKGLIPDNAAIDKATEGGKKILTSIRKNVGQEAGAHKLEAQMASTKACQQYCSALAAITSTVASRNQVFQLSSQTFGEDPATGKSPVYAAASAAARLKTGISGAGADPVFSQLLHGPLEFLWSYLLKESAAHLQSLWEEQVLAGTMGMTDRQAIPALLGPDGLAWKFVKGPAAPFLTRSLAGYRAKEALGGKIPFETALFSFMNKGSKAQAAVMAMGRPQNYSVCIKGLPTGANVEARIKPQVTRLEVQCGGNSQNLVNYNYPVGRTFSWSSDTCGDVLFQIEVGDVILTKHYSGQQGFPEFLKDLHGGRRTFLAREFPAEMHALQGMGVKSITVNYKFVGSDAILQQSATLSGQAPRNVARSWTP